MEWLNTLLGAGAAATLWTIFRGVQMLRNDTTARTDKAVADLERWRQEADERTRAAREDADHYLNLADHWREEYGSVVFLARAAGVTLPDPRPLPQRPAPRIQET
jgi:DNA-binding PadR family transcriptional regulator